MGKNKIMHFREMLTFPNVVQPHNKELFLNDHPLKGKWCADWFKRDAPLVLELGCGKGEYTVGLARKHPEMNFIGIDYKGARIWRGAKTAYEEQLPNVLFIRARIDFICHLFAENEVSEIWITFPDPQLTKERKRLTAPMFRDRYKTFLKPEGIIHLKTDSVELFDYTLEEIENNNYVLLRRISDIHHIGLDNELTQIRTFYENMFVSEGKPIHYLAFSLNEKVC